MSSSMLTLDIACGKGTYIRSLARDLGAALGVGGMLAGLRRTRVGAFGIGDCRELDELPARLTGVRPPRLRCACSPRLLPNSTARFFESASRALPDDCACVEHVML